MNVQQSVEHYMSEEVFYYYTGDCARHLEIPTGAEISRYRMGCFSHITVEGLPMKKKGAVNERSNGGFQPITWVNVPLTDDHENEIIRWNPDDATLLSAIIQMVELGHSWGCKDDARGNGYMAFATGTRPDCPNAGHGLSAFSADPRDAIASLVYKHVAICDGHWPKSSSDQKRRFR